MNTEHTSYAVQPDGMSRERVAAIFRLLREADATCGSANQHDRAVVLIMICIDQGFDAGPQICGVLKSMGLDSQHAGMTLKQGKGSNPDFHRWWSDDSGKYHLHAPRSYQGPIPGAATAADTL